MAADEYHVGDEIKLTAVFRVDRVETAPTAVFADVYAPSSSTPTTYSYPASGFTSPKTGVYELIVDCTEAGNWAVAWRSTGVAKAAEPFLWTVDPLV